MAYGDEVRRLADRVIATTPYPPGVKETFDFQSYRSGVDAKAEMGGSIEAFIQFRAQCYWREYWLSAVRAGDESGRAAAPFLRGSTMDSMRGSAALGTAQKRALQRRAPPLPKMSTRSTIDER